MRFSKKDIEIPILNQPITIGGTKELERGSFIESMEDEGQSVIAHTWAQDGVIFMSYSDSMTQDVLAHEIVHIISFLFKAKGIKYDVDNDEFQGYLTGWLFKELNEHIFGEDIQPCTLN